MANDETRRGDEGGPDDTSPDMPSGDRDEQNDDPNGEPDTPPDVLGMVPRNRRAPFTRAFNSVTQIVAPAVNPALEKITSAHFSKMLDNAENERIRESEADNSRRKYQFAYFLIGLLAIIGLLVFFTLTDNGELIVPLITGALGFFGGLAAGRYTRRD